MYELADCLFYSDHVHLLQLVAAHFHATRKEKCAHSFERDIGLLQRKILARDDLAQKTLSKAHHRKSAFQKGLVILTSTSERGSGQNISR